jgi:hypothetical protein
MTAASSRLLWAAWGLSFMLAVACAAVFFQGIIRDKRPFDPEIRLDLSTQSEWITTPFRVWGEKSYSLLIGSVSHDPARVGRPLTAELEVRVLDPNDQVVFYRAYPPGETEHTIPNNYGDVRLATLKLSDWTLRSWALQVRVTEPDPGFASVRSTLRLYEQRSHLGMGGLVTYAMIIPAGILMLLALVLAVFIARHSSRLPLLATVLASIPLFLVLG